jgi:hypothetical protein
MDKFSDNILLNLIIPFLKLDEIIRFGMCCRRN